MQLVNRAPHYGIHSSGQRSIPPAFGLVRSTVSGVSWAVEVRELSCRPFKFSC